MKLLDVGDTCWIWTERQNQGYIILHCRIDSRLVHKEDAMVQDATYWVIPDGESDSIIRGSDFVFSTEHECREKLLKKLLWCAQNERDKIKHKRREILHYEGMLNYYKQQINKFEE